jgi:hypothetical protein
MLAHRPDPDTLQAYLWNSEYDVSGVGGLYVDHFN